MKQWLQQLGHSSPRLDSLNIIHVAGTKGKGSTCAYIESFLRAQGNGRSFPRKTGLYTSPHLLQMNERIRINFEPLDEARFAQYVFEVRDGLSLYNINHGPRFLQLLAIISIHAFVHEGVDYDSTNFVKHPVITAITSIGLDHVSDLGPTIEDIAWHKAGILKAGATTFCAPQEPTAKQVSLKVVGMNTELPGHFASDVQRLNCSLAQAISDEFLRRTVPKGQLPYLSQQAVVDGIQRFHWPGRFEIIRAGQVTWYLDGAHNELSITEAAQWFQIASRSQQLVTVKQC
ncbi:Mur ligase [Cryphonectria parasitica EP155]|uniref:tetrahydrofolate synthase n=1 Tax=Cryphonectria parasitica (strain ATCC 38755 / EP155) TaxID=660469 RepID=A0A9P5CSD4_CRYP1|nr:Mur ligase [Cryphonectria parasitica EP155]KAF3768467.1 Mur ligase [Cryphonectria parasitica EP155]